MRISLGCTGTPTILVELLKKQDVAPRVLSGYEAAASELDSIQVRAGNPIAVLNGQVEEFGDVL